MENQTHDTSSQKITIPGAIVIAGLFIAGAILFSNFAGKGMPNQAAVAGDTSSIDPVTASDHILGNPDAPIKIVEYSDTSCPFCKSFHPTMRAIMDEYGKNGDVAWVYRHYPLAQIHPKANREAQAMECAAELGGNDKFWAYTNRIYEITPAVTNSNPQGLDDAQLPLIAQYVGLDKTAFLECLNSGRTAKLVDQDFISGQKAGVTGTPFSYILIQDGTNVPIAGAQQYGDIKKAIDSLLSQAR